MIPGTLLIRGDRILVIIRIMRLVGSNNKPGCNGIKLPPDIHFFLLFKIDLFDFF